MTDEEKKMIINMGALGYPVEKIIIVMLPGDPERFQKEFEDPNSEIKKHYQHGVHLAQYKIDLKLLEMAQSGDLRAMEKRDIMKKRASRDKSKE